MSGIIILSILFALFVSYYIISEGELAKRILPWAKMLAGGKAETTYRLRTTDLSRLEFLQKQHAIESKRSLNP